MNENFEAGFEKEAGLRINLAPKAVAAPKIPTTPQGPFEKLRQAATAPGNMRKMRAGQVIVGAGALGVGGVKAMNWLTGNEPDRPDW